MYCSHSVPWAMSVRTGNQETRSLLLACMRRSMKIVRDSVWPLESRHPPYPFRYWSFGLWCLVHSNVHTNVSEGHAASTFPEDGSNMFLWNFGFYTDVHKTSQTQKTIFGIFTAVRTSNLSILFTLSRRQIAYWTRIKQHNMLYFENCISAWCKPGSSVSIGSGYGLDGLAIEVRTPAEAKGFFL
jgi:hypothetical protein